MHERLKHTGDLLQIDKNQFMKIPLYVPDETEAFEKLVDKILTCKAQNPKVDTGELEAKIDKMVYELYELNDDEIALIEGKQ
jgi:adenine-specific DNA-methyltransferase